MIDQKNKKNQIYVGVLISHSPFAQEVEKLKEFAVRMTDGARREIEAATGIGWKFHMEEPVRLADDEARYPSDFLDHASQRMVEGPYDAIIVISDVSLVSRRRRAVPGLASMISRIAVISTRKLLTSPRGEPVRSLDSDYVRWNAVRLLLHLTGHLLGLEHPKAGDRIMSNFALTEPETDLPRFDKAAREKLKSAARRFPERTQIEGGALRSLAFHLTSAARHPRDVIIPVWRNRSPLIPLSLPRLATAAVAPTLILIFSAESWDVALHLDDFTAWTTALVSVFFAAWYLMLSLKLLFPRKERRVTTEHAAIVNVSVFFTLFIAVIGLFLMIFVLMLAIEYFIFPPNLMREWYSLENPTVTIVDKIRLAAFISTLGVVTGALAGGLESRAVIRQFALFREDT